MELTQEMNQLLLCCKDKEYIRTNLENLRAYFSVPQAICLLKFALTTNKHFIALKIIEKLNLKVIPYLHINSFTYISLFWLHKMGLVFKDEFILLSRNFQILKNFDILEEETENSFMRLQMEKRRRKFKKRRNSKEQALAISLFKGIDYLNNNYTFVFYLDDLFNIEKQIESFSELRNGLFLTDLNSFEEFPGDIDKTAKQNRFKELKVRLINSPIRNFTNFFVLDSETKNKLEDLMDALSRIKKCGFRYYLCSQRPLSSILTFCYLFINCMDLTKIIETKTGQELDTPFFGKKIVFGSGNIKYEFLKETVSNLMRFI